MKNTIHNFLEYPRTKPALVVHASIIVVIFISVALFSLDYLYPSFANSYGVYLRDAEYVILALFTIEYAVRLLSAPNKRVWVTKPMSIIDLLAIAPSFLAFGIPVLPNVTALRVLRLLRASRILRILKLVRYKVLFRDVIRFRQTILQSIFPVLLLFAAIKGVFAFLEVNAIWAPTTELGELFAIIGFALGIFLSQKIATTYSKFLEVEETCIRLYGTLRSLSLILNQSKEADGDAVCQAWGRTFLSALSSEHGDEANLHQAHAALYHEIAKVEDAPAELAILHGDMVRDATFCMSKKTRLTPKAYDTLVHQATMLYLALLAIFVPGWVGLLSTLVATYILYGMYNVTQDLDSILGGEFNLINIDISEFKAYVS